MRKRKPVLSIEDVEYLNGLLAAFDDLPDGAWTQACQDAIEADSRFKGCDPYDVWISWVSATSTKVK